MHSGSKHTLIRICSINRTDANDESKMMHKVDE